MILKRSVLLVLLTSLILQAQEGELTLDPNDIPLTPDPTLDVPTDNTNTIQVPNLDNAIPDAPPAESTPTLDTVPTPVAPPQAAPTPAPTLAPEPATQIEEHKPTPSNLSVKPESTVDIQKKEERFNRDYTKFHKDSTSEQNWEKVVGKRTSDTYIVNKGDTLWDISGTLFGDPFYWPKIWSLNKDLIYNPHVIFPDMKIKFYQGNSKAAPTLATDNTTTPTPTPPPTPEAVSEKKDDASGLTAREAGTDVPDNARISHGVVKLPKIFQNPELSIKKNIEVQVEERKIGPLESNIVQEFYISESPIVGSGQVVELPNQFTSAGDGQYVFIKFDAQPSGTYTILKPGKRLRTVRDVTYEVEVYEVEGEVKVLGAVNTAENVYRAKVLKTNTLVSKGSMAIAGNMKRFKHSDAISESTASRGRIIGTLGEYTTVGQDAFVIIDQGSQSGYQPNMSLPIYEELEARNLASLKSYVKENPRRIGRLTIVDVTARYSIGYITKITDHIAVGDIVATPEGGEFNPESAKVDESSLETAPTDGAPVDETAPVEEF